MQTSGGFVNNLICKKLTSLQWSSENFSGGISRVNFLEPGGCVAQLPNLWGVQMSVLKPVGKGGHPSHHKDSGWITETTTGISQATGSPIHVEAAITMASYE